MKGGYLDENTILESVRKDFNMSKKEIKEFWKLHKEYVQNLMDQEDTDYIKLPHLGNLYFNSNYNNRLNNRVVKGLDLERQERIKDKVSKEKEETRKVTNLTRFPQIERPIIFKIVKQIYSKFASYKKSYLNKRRMFKVLENYSYDTLENKDLFLTERNE